MTELLDEGVRTDSELTDSALSGVATMVLLARESAPPDDDDDDDDGVTACELELPPIARDELRGDPDDGRLTPPLLLLAGPTFPDETSSIDDEALSGSIPSLTMGAQCPSTQTLDRTQSSSDAQRAGGSGPQDASAPRATTAIPKLPVRMQPPDEKRA